MASSIDPDQTAPQEVVLTALVLFANDLSVPVLRILTECEDQKFSQCSQLSSNDFSHN